MNGVGFILLALCLLVPVLALAQTPSDGSVKSFQKISASEGSFTATLDNSDNFGRSVAALGDLDGDGVPDLAVGAYLDDDGGSNRGAVYVLFMNADGTVKSHQKISDTEGGFTATLDNSDYFGASVAALGDLDGDGVPDLAVGAYRDDDGGVDLGAVYVLFLNTDGTVKSYQKISDTEGGFTATLDNSDYFGFSVAALGDLDGDTVPDLAVGAQRDDDGLTDRGALYVLFMNTDGTVKAYQKISDTQGSFTAVLDNSDYFGSSITALGDLDGDTVPDLVVGAYLDDDGGGDRGAVYVLLLNADGTVKSYQKISDTDGNFTATLDNSDWFGFSVAAPGDLDGDGVPDLAVGAYLDDDGSIDRGAVYVLFLNADGTVKAFQKISDTVGNFTATLDNYDHLGVAVAALGDLDGDGVTELAVGTDLDDDGGGDRGAVYVLFLKDAPLADSSVFTLITAAPVTTDGGNSRSSSWGDYDNDGDLDLFVANYGQTNFLYTNNGDSTFTKVTTGAIVTDVDNSRGSSWGDYDNDGDLDLFVSNNGNNRLYTNNGDGSFTSITTSVVVSDGGNSVGAAWGDYDNDGDLDLFVSNSSNQNNFLYTNHGNGFFAKVTAGPVVTEGSYSEGCAWGDYDGDGDLDLFVANNNQSNFLYTNNGDGTFTKVISGPVVSDGASSYGGSWGDADNDGDLDLFVANYNQNNLLYANNGDGSFTQITAGSVVSDGGYSFGSAWGDYDNDGDPDLVVANINNQNNFKYTNYGDGTFLRAETGAVVTGGGNSYGASWGDFDNDGDLDLFVTNYNQNNFLYANQGNSNHWINLQLAGTQSNKSAIGAKVRVKATIGGSAVWQSNEISAQTGQWGQNSLNAEFGLGDATIIDSIKVEWPSGVVQVLTNQTVDQFLTITEPDVAPPAPQNLVAEVGNGRVTLRWTRSTGAELSHYVVYQGTSPAPTDSVEGADKFTTTVIRTGLTNGTPYYFRVAAIDSAGNRSDYSNEVGATPLLPIIVQMEYFFDTDPGFGNGTQVSITPGAIIDISFNADLTNEPDGFHYLFVRTKDVNGDWSHPHIQPFLKATLDTTPAVTTLLDIVQLEYFIDTDPGLGSGIQVPVSPDSLVDSTFTASLTSVPDGFHYLMVRAKDADGNWTHPVIRPFLKSTISANPPAAPKTITSIHYTISKGGTETDAGVYADFTPTANLDLEFNIDVSTLQVDSTYDLRLSVKNEDSTPSFFVDRSFYLVERWVTYPTPSTNAINIDPAADLSIPFTKGIAEASLNNSTVVIRGSLSGPHTAISTFEGATKTATVNPDVDFAIGELVTVTLTTGIQSILGDPMSAPYIWSFTTSVPSGSGVFGAGGAVAAGSQPYGAIPGDFNGDGLLDLAVANNSSDNITILLNDGGGGFNQDTTITVGDGPDGIVAGDWDGDGDLDLAIANMNSDNVTILTNDGNGNFTPSSTPAAGDRPRGIITGDWDGDGDLDLATANEYSDNISILINDGSGAFTPGSTPAVGNGPIGVAIGDWDNDGDLDLATANYNSDNVSILANDGTGTFALSATVGAGNGAGIIIAGDWDDDGDADLAVTNYLADNLSILINDGNGTFSSSATISTGDGARGVTAGDWDSDGDLDLAVANVLADNVSILANDGLGTYSLIRTHNAGDGSRYIIAGDWDGDGDLDLATANQNSNNVSILLNKPQVDILAATGSLSFGLVESLTARELTLTIRNDGGLNPLDISGIVSSGSDFTITPATASINALESQDFTVTFAPNEVRHYSDSLTISSNDPDEPQVVIQLTGTSAPTVVAAGPPGNSLGGNNTDNLTATFNAAMAPATINDSTFLVFGEVSGQHFGTVTYDAGSKTATLNPARDFVFGEKVTAVLTDSIKSLADGIDLVGGHSWQFSVAPLFGSGAFVAEGSTLSTGGAPFTVAAGDFNRDGYSDLAAANSSAGTVSIFLNDQLGGYGAPASFAVGTNPQGLAIGDVNADGNPDLVVANNGSDNISVLMGQGDGSFATAVDYATGAGPRAIAIGDLDHDGLQDIVTGNITDDDISILFNLGDGTFGDPTSIAIGGDVSGVAIADLDNDGDMDLAVSDKNASAITILLNGTGANQVQGAGQALQFDGVNDYVDVIADNNALDLNGTEVTIECLFNMQGTDGSLDIIFGKTAFNFNDYLIYVNGTNRLSALIRTSGETGIDGSTLLMNAWYHAALTYDGSNIILYLNGIEDARTPKSGNLTGSSSPIGIGGRADGADFNGIIDEVRIWNVARTQAEIQATMNLTLAGNEAGLVGYWRFDEGGGTTTEDNSGNGNTGTLNGPTWITSTVPLSTVGQVSLGTFIADSTYTTGAAPNALVAYDFDGDGDVDLATANGDGNNISVLLNDGAGVFGAATNLPAGTVPIDLAAGDFDADGDIDLAALNFTTNDVHIFSNDGVAAFTVSDTVAVGSGPRNLAALDISGTLGIMDLAVANLVGADISLLRNQIPGGLLASVALAASGEQSGDVTLNYNLYDVNGDSIGILAEYNTVGDAAWYPATVTGDTSRLGRDQYRGALLWNSDSNLAQVDLDSARFRITASSAATSQGDTTGWFALDNDHSQSVAIALLDTIPEYSDSIRVRFTLTDSTYDILSLSGYYQVGGGVWEPATLAGVFSELDSSRYTDTLTWVSGANLAGLDDSVRFKLVPTDGWADGPPDSTNAFHLDNNAVPSVTLASITGEQTGDIAVSYTLSDAETDSLSISLFYTVDSSLTWLPATISGDTLGVTVYTGALTWNSASDLAGQDLAAVRLYLAPADKDPGSADTTGYFQVDNNAPPTVAIDSQPGEWIGDIPIWFDLVDAEGDSITILAEFQEIGTATWQNATVTGDLTGITVARDSIVWHSDSDLTEFVGDIYFRIIPTDADTGLADTITINIDQIGAPQILTLTIPEGELSGAIEVSFALQDDESDTVDLYLEYSLDDSASWTAGTISGETTDLDTTRYSGILTWQSGLDTAGIDHAAVLLRVRPWDGHWGPYAYTGPFHLDNNLPPVATAIDLVGEQSGDFPFSYQLSDAENDTLSVTLYYSSDDGDNWSQATASGTTTDLTATQGTLIWHSGTDLPGVDITTAKLLLVPVDADTGTADTTASFHLDNYFGHAVALTLKDTQSEYSDTVGLGVVLSDPTSDVLSVQGYYRVDQSAWVPATLIGDTTGLTAGQYQPALAWDSRADLPGQDLEQVRLKIFPFDNWMAGSADSTVYFHLDNNQPPRIITTLVYDEYAGLLPIPYRITDPEGDTLGFQVDYSTDRLATWTEATLVNPGARIRPQDYQDTLYWDTAADLPYMDVDSVWLRLQVSDLDTGIGDTTIIHIDNEIGPRVTSVYPAAGTLGLWQDTIWVTLTHPLSQTTVAGQVSLTGGKFSPAIASATVMDSHLVIIPALPMSSLDTIKVTLTANITDTNGISLDGNGNGDPDGSPVDDYSWSYHTTVLGDYDLDGVVGFSDLVYFRTAWFSSPQLLDFELSPVVGDIPALRVIPDGKLDIADLAVLARMWDWSISANMSLLAEGLNKGVYGDTLIQLTPVYDDKNWDKITKREFAISVSLTEQITTPALEIKLLLDPDVLTYEGFEIQGIPDQEKAKWTVLDYYDAETGFLVLELIDFTNHGPALAHEFGLIKFSVLAETEIHTPFEYAIAQYDSGMTIIRGAASKIISTVPPVPKSFTLHQNFPNPFNPTTRIRYEIAQETQVALAIYNILGQEVFNRKEGYLSPGYYELLWNGRDQTGRQVSSGIYFVRLITAQYTKSIKMMMLK